MYTPLVQKKNEISSQSFNSYTPIAQSKDIGIKEQQAPFIAPDFSVATPTPQPTAMTTPAYGTTTDTLGVVKGVYGFGKDILRGIARSAAMTGVTLANKLEQDRIFAESGGKIKRENIPTQIDTMEASNIQNLFGQSLWETALGKEPVYSIEKATAKMEENWKDLQVELDSISNTPGLTYAEKTVINTLRGADPKLLSFPLVMGGVGLDITPFGGLEKNATKALIKTTEEEAPILLRKMRVPEELIPKLAPEVGRINSEMGAKTFLENLPLKIKQLQESKPKITTTTYTPIVQKPVYQGETDLTIKTLEKLKGRTEVSKQYVSDLTNASDLKQAERDIVRDVLTTEGDIVNVPKFAEKVKAELLPLEANKSGMKRTAYEEIALPKDLRGNVADYRENIYSSPIKTSAGGVHFGAEPNYFGHTRVEDMAPSSYVKGEFAPAPGTKGETRRVIEVQSDLYQKGRLEGEFQKAKTSQGERILRRSDEGTTYDVTDDYNKLSQYNDPTAHFRMVREEVKRAAIDGKTKLQFPTGETAMKIEGLAGRGNKNYLHYEDSTPLKPSDLQYGQKFNDQRYRGAGSGNFVVLDKTGNDTFNAIHLKYDAPDILQESNYGEFSKEYIDALNQYVAKNKNSIETFSIAEEIDTNNPIYRFYEKDLGRYLKSKYDARFVTDDKGVTWWEVNVKKEYAKSPVEAFGAVGGIEQDEEGKIRFDPLKAALGVAGIRALGKENRKKAVEIIKKLKGSVLKSGVFSQEEYTLFKALGLDKYVDEAIKAGDSIIIDPDDIKYLVEDTSEESARIFSRQAELQYDYALKVFPGEKVNFLMGGPGSGKSEIGRNSLLGESRIIYDAPNVDKNVLDRRWEKAIGANKTPSIKMILGDIKDSYKYTLIREIIKERKVSTEYFATAHSKKIETAISLIEENKDLILKDTRSITDIGKAKQAKWEYNPQDMLAKLREVRYSKDEILNQIKDVKLTPEQINKARAEKEALARTDARAGEIGVRGSEAGQPRGRLGGDNGVRQSSEIVYKNLSNIAEKIKRKITTQQAYNEIRTALAISEGAIEQLPGKQLMKYVSRTTGKLPEVTGETTMKSLTGSGTTVKGSIFRQQGDQIITELGFKDLDDAERGLEAYLRARDRIKELKEFARDARAEKSLVKKGERLMVLAKEDRRIAYRAVRDRYNLTESEMATIRRGRDIMAMEQKEFDTFIQRAEIKGEALEKLREARTGFKGTVHALELQKVENLQEAMKFPSFEKMTVEQLNKLEEILSQYKKGDEFLPVRQLETINQTELQGIRTVREVKDYLARKYNLTADQLPGIKPHKWMYDTQLARQHPLYDLMVTKYNESYLKAGGRIIETERKADDLIKIARASRPRTLGQKAIPTDKKIVEWLEAENRVALEKDMTDAEIDAARYMDSVYKEYYDWLSKRALDKRFESRFEDKYFPHVRRGFLEAWKEDGFMKALKEASDQFINDERMLTILDEKTNTILPYQKWVGFSQFRTGGLVPTENASRAFKAYITALEKARQFDEFIPEIMIYVHSLSPKGLTPRGVEMDDTLQKFVKTWINSKKGRVEKQIVTPGGKLDWALRTGVALTRIRDLGLNVPVGIANIFGEQAGNLTMLGAKNYSLGLARLATKKGRDITRNYAEFVGKSLFEKLGEASNNIGDELLGGIFGLFGASSRKANQVFLLGSMTREEFAKGTISLERLAELRNKAGKYRVVEGAESIFGKSVEGAIAGQYKRWAIPIIVSTTNNAKQFARLLRVKGVKAALSSPEGSELFYSIVLGSALGIGIMGYYNELGTDKNRSFVEDIVYKSMRDSLSLIGAVDPKFLGSFSTPRLASFIVDITTALDNIMLLQKYKTTGELKGLKQLKSALTPTLVSSFMKSISEPTTQMPKRNLKIPSGLPQLPSLKKSLPALPKLPKL